MARKSTPAPPKTSAALSDEQIRVAISKIWRRLQELSALDIDRLDNETGGHVLDSCVQKINSTMREIYGIDSIEYDEYSFDTFQPVFMIWYDGMDSSLRGNLDTAASVASVGWARRGTRRAHAIIHQSAPRGPANHLSPLAGRGRRAKRGG
jgi:hypothetical protein